MKLGKKITSIILCLSLLLSFPFAIGASGDYSPAEGEFVFSSEDMLSYIKDPYSVDVSFDKSEEALKMTVNNDHNAIDPRALLDMSGLGLKAADYKSLLVIYKVPDVASGLAHATEFFISAGTVTGPAAGKSVTCSLTKSNTFTSYIIDLSALSWWRGDVHSVRIDPFTSASVGDTMYIDSVILCSDYSDAIATRDARLAELNKIETPQYANTDYICTSYEYDKYTSPFWKGNIVYNEAVYPIKDKNGNATYTLMYTPDEITSVYSSDFTSLYYEGIDYTVSGNQITFLNSGNIRLKDYNYIHPQSNPYGYSGDVYYKRTAAGDGKWEYWGQSAEFFNGYINVSYTHSDTWNDYVPEDRSSEIPLTASKITNKGAMNVVFYGDSICGGANSSSYRDVYPYAEYWNEMIVSKLRKDYGVKINATYSSVGGSTASGMVNQITSEVISRAPDLVFIEFGANDAMNESQSSSGSLSKLKSEYKSAIIKMIDKVRASYPKCEFVLVAPFYCNPYCHYMSYFEGCRDALNEIADAYSGVTVADVTAMHKSLLEYKDYLDFSGDNMCHPNDYMARFYAQVCLETIVPGGIEPYTVDEEPPVVEPEVGKNTYAAPSGYGWQWPAAEAYGYIGNYGGNGQDIEFTADLALISSAAEGAVAQFRTAEGGYIEITPSSVKLGNAKTYTYDWGDADISNWHTVTIKILNGRASVYIDGEIIGKEARGFKAYTDYQLFFSYLGCMAIDNMSMKTSTGTVYFDCDFENESEAKNLMSEGLGARTLLAANSIVYDMNGGEGEIKNQIKVISTPILLSDTVPTRENHTFLGWATNKDATAPEYLAGAVYTADASAILYAVWQADYIPDPEPEPEPERTVGDLNGDGAVNAMDLNVMRRIVASVITPDDGTVKAGDLNCDGSINAVDANTLSRMLSGQE